MTADKVLTLSQRDPQSLQHRLAEAGDSHTHTPSWYCTPCTVSRQARRRWLQQPLDQPFIHVLSAIHIESLTHRGSSRFSARLVLRELSLNAFWERKF